MNMRPTPISRTPPIGTFLNSSITFEPTSVNAHRFTAINVSFAFSADLGQGDVVTVHLPDFYACANDSMHLTGDNDASSFVASWEAESLMFTVMRRVAANTSVAFFLDLEARVQYPVGGVRYDAAAIRISTNCPAGPVLPSRFNLLRGIGTFVHSSVSFSRFWLDQPVGVEFDFSFNHDLPHGAVVVLNMPGFTAPRLASGANVTLVDQVMGMGAHFKAAWTNGSLAFTVVAAIGIPAGPVHIEVDETNGIRLPAAGLPYTTDIMSLTVREFPEMAIKESYVATAPVIGFQTAVMTFTNPTAGEATGIDFKFGLSGNN